MTTKTLGFKKGYVDAIKQVQRHDAATYHSIIGALYSINGGKNYYVDMGAFCKTLEPDLKVHVYALLTKTKTLQEAGLLEPHPKNNEYIRLANIQTGEYARKELLKIHPSFAGLFTHFHKVLVNYLPEIIN